MKEKIVVALAPHTDDIEIGCGGAISKLAREGCTIHCVAFSTCDEWLPEGFPKGTLIQEFKNAARVFDIQEKNIKIYNFRATELSLVRDKIFDILFTLNKELNPDIVFCPSSEDTHQDHQTIFEEARRVFKGQTILGYEMPRNNLHFKTNCHFVLTKEDLEKKLKAINCYESQSSKQYTRDELVYSLARVRGLQAETEFAEAFEVIRLAIK